MNKKKIAKVMLGIMLLTGVFSKSTLPQAKSFLMALAPHSNWRAKDAADLKDVKEWSNTWYGYVKLDKIQDLDSYTMSARAVANPNGDLESADNAYSEPVTVRQGAPAADVYEYYWNKRMQVGSTYYLALKNLNYTQNYRNAVGSFGWY
ncbi:hypothetical protein [Clostridium sp. LIBA-8841]|uniref:hypothetical protein n=1 Tax=Clostridium sp. LIBA-8841 TaxID=2987530 RepID=UPI002AC6B78B|nr:hypothetical protein [Clostridium sp. LIBA-8841]MDZ5253800.1 hypothetical protein [Clostridium sp. LIBA-8841]